MAKSSSKSSTLRLWNTRIKSTLSNLWMNESKHVIRPHHQNARIEGNIAGKADKLASYARSIKLHIGNKNLVFPLIVWQLCFWLISSPSEAMTYSGEKNGKLTSNYKLKSSSWSINRWQSFKALQTFWFFGFGSLSTPNWVSGDSYRARMIIIRARAGDHNLLPHIILLGLVRKGLQTLLQLVDLRSQALKITVISMI